MIEMVHLEKDQVVSVIGPTDMGNHLVTRVNMQNKQEGYTVSLYSKMDKRGECMLITHAELSFKGYTDPEVLPHHHILDLYRNKTLRTAMRGEVFDKFGKMCSFTTKSKVKQTVRYELKEEKEEARYQVIFKELSRQSKKGRFDQSMALAYEMNYLKNPNGENTGEIKKNEQNVHDYITQFAWHLLFYHNRTIRMASKQNVVDFFQYVTKEHEQTYRNYTIDIVELYEEAMARQNRRIESGESIPKNEMLRMTQEDIRELRAEAPTKTRSKIKPLTLPYSAVEDVENAILKEIDDFEDKLTKELDKPKSKRVLPLQNKLSKKVRDYAMFLLIKHYGLYSSQITEMRKTSREDTTQRVIFHYDENDVFLPCMLVEEGKIFLGPTSEPIEVTEQIKKHISKFYELSGNDSPYVFAHTQKLGEEANFRQIAPSMVRRACEGLTAEKLRNFAIEQALRVIDAEDEVQVRKIAVRFKTSDYTIEHFIKEIQDEKQNEESA